MALKTQYEVRRFSGGLDNSTSTFGHTTAKAEFVGTRGRGVGSPASTFRQATTKAAGVNVKGSLDSFSVDPSDADGTGVWIQPVSGGELRAYPRSVTTATLANLTTVTAASYGRDSDGTELMILYGDGGTKDKVVVLGSDGTEGAVLHTMTTGNGARASITRMNDQFLICNGVDNPISIDIATQTVTNPITEDRLDITAGGGVTAVAQNASEGNVIGIVKYYISEVTGSGDTLSESALSVSIQEDASQNNSGAGDQILLTFPNNAEFNGKTIQFRLSRI